MQSFPWPPTTYSCAQPEHSKCFCPTQSMSYRCIGSRAPTTREKTSPRDTEQPGSGTELFRNSSLLNQCLGSLWAPASGKEQLHNRVGVAKTGSSLQLRRTMGTCTWGCDSTAIGTHIGRASDPCLPMVPNWFRGLLPLGKWTHCVERNNTRLEERESPWAWLTGFLFQHLTGLKTKKRVLSLCFLQETYLRYKYAKTQTHRDSGLD